MITGGVRKKSAEQISLPGVTSDGKKYFNELKVGFLFTSTVLLTVLQN